MARWVPADSIPQEVQQPIRQRLTMMRESKKLTKAEVGVISTNALLGWEEEDISTMKLSALMKLAQRYGMDFVSFMQYLFSAEGLNILDAGQQYYTALPEEFKSTAVDMLRSLHSLSVKNKLVS